MGYDTMSNNEILKIENLKKTYSNTTEPVLKGIDLSIYEEISCVCLDHQVVENQP